MGFKIFFIVSFISIFLLSVNSVKAEISQVEVQNIDIINNSISEEIKNNRYIDVSIANNFSEPIIDLAYSLTQVFAYLKDKLETRVSFMVRNKI
jgi:hypothetical protein